MSKQSETRDYWSECGQVFFLDGYGWGFTEKGPRICLGREEDILRFFKTGQLNGDLYPKQKEELSWVLEYRKEQGYGEQSGNRADRLDRRRPDKVTRHNKENIRQPKERKRATIR